jgi:hemoglobin/transferrin/lactoferrin receptor protein
MVVVATRRAQPREDVAGSVSAISRGEIERLQAQDLRDVVRDEPGVAFISDPSRFGLDGFSIRGLQGNRVAVEVDGVPMLAAHIVAVTVLSVVFVVLGVTFRRGGI